MFSAAYDAYTILPEDVRYFDSKSPFSQLVYRSALPRYREEDYLKLLLSMSVNRHVTVGGLFNYIYGRGQYANQSSSLMNGGVWASYTGKRYECLGSVMFNSFKNFDNGGITNPLYITDPQAIVGSASFESWNIPTNLTGAQTKYHNYNYFFHQRYSLGVERPRTLPNDSIVYDFIPVTTFSHSIRFEDIGRNYTEKDSITTGFYQNNYFSGKFTNDNLRYWSLKNTLAVTFEEAYNRKLMFGLKAFVEYDLRHYNLTTDTFQLRYFYSNNLKVGGVLSKEEGKYIKYNFNGYVYVLGPQIGEFGLYGNIYGFFNIGKEPFEVSGGAAFMKNSNFSLEGKYLSNHFAWLNNFDFFYQTQFNGRLSMPKRNISVGVNFENISNYIYYGYDAKPAQYDGNIQVLAIDATINLKAWWLHWDNKLVYQMTSNPELLPLPDLALYTNLYYKGVWFKVLTAQIGVSCRYTTAYYGPTYMPATGIFYLQNEMMVGNYPEMNVYANFHLKRMRFYVQYYHWNKGLFGGNNYFSMPNYPINPGTFQFGLSWTFHG